MRLPPASTLTPPLTCAPAETSTACPAETVSEPCTFPLTDSVTLTVIVCCIWVAARWFASPSWFASTMHVPTPMNETVPFIRTQAPALLEASMLNTTGFEEAPPVAVGVYEWPTSAGLTGDDVNVITWLAFSAFTDSATSGAAL